MAGQKEGFVRIAVVQGNGKPWQAAKNGENYDEKTTCVGNYWASA